jgi:hypothetical protein
MKPTGLASRPKKMDLETRALIERRVRKHLRDKNYRLVEEPAGRRRADGKKIHHRISNETIKELEAIIKKLQAAHPGRRVFVDADEFAICSEARHE